MVEGRHSIVRSQDRRSGRGRDEGEIQRDVCDHMYFFLTLSILVITDQVQKEKKKKYLQEKIACTLSYKLFLFQNIKVEIGRYKD